MAEKSVLFDNDGVFGTDLNAAFTAQALVLVHHFALFILKFVNFDGTNIYTLSATDAFVLVHGNTITH